MNTNVGDSTRLELAVSAVRSASPPTGPEDTMHDVIYLTGAPASGKSTLTRSLKAQVSNLAIFEYGARLTELIRNKGGVEKQSDLRELSAQIVTPADVAEVDKQLIHFVADNRSKSSVIVDSHAVTKERYGYRVTPYKLTEFERLNPTQIWVLYTPPEVAVDRIAKDAQGRPTITIEQARFHTQLQSGVAVTYGMHLGIAVHLFDSSGSMDELSAALAKRLR